MSYMTHILLTYLSKCGLRKKGAIIILFASLAPWINRPTALIFQSHGRVLKYQSDKESVSLAD